MAARPCRAALRLQLVVAVCQWPGAHPERRETLGIGCCDESMSRTERVGSSCMEKQCKGDEADVPSPRVFGGEKMFVLRDLRKRVFSETRQLCTPLCAGIGNAFESNDSQLDIGLGLFGHSGTSQGYSWTISTSACSSTCSAASTIASALFSMEESLSFASSSETSFEQSRSLAEG